MIMLRYDDLFYQPVKVNVKTKKVVVKESVNDNVIDHEFSLIFNIRVHPVK